MCIRDSYNINEVALTEYIYNDAWDFHLSANSPALTGALTVAPFTPYFASGLTLGGITYASPALAPYFGAYGK